MNLFTLVGEILLRGTDEAKRGIKEVSDSAEESESRLTTAMKGIGAAVAAAFALDKIRDFGISIVNASAEVSAEVSAFKQIMGDYSDNAQTKLNEIADATGVVSTRLTPYMTSLTAKFKGLGYDVSDATDLAQRGLYLASDASAFWDKSLEDSMSALNSFINGSYEGGEAIGLFANDTQLAQYAIEKGLVDSSAAWSELDEATKQATRLEYAENMMKQSGATGQAAKESGAYANVQANLAETWRQFKAEIGEPLLQNVVIPAMKALQEVVGFLSDKWKELNDWIKDNKDKINEWIDIIILAGTMVAAYVVTLGALSIIKTVTGWIKAMASGQAILNAVMAINPVALVVAALAGLVVIFVKCYNESETFRNIVNNAASAVKKAWLAMVDWFKSLPETFKNLWNSVKTWTVNTWNSISSSTKNIWNSLKTSVVNIATSLVDGVKKWFTNLKTGIQNIWNSTKSAASSAWNSLKNGVSNIVSNFVNGVKNKINSLKSGIQSIWSSIKSTATSLWNSLKNSVVSVVSNLISNIKNKFSSFKSTASSIWNSIKSGIVNAISSLPGKMLSIGRDIVEGLWNGINNATDWVVSKVTSFGSKVTGGIKKFFGIASPSKVFAELGKFLAEGLGIGIEKNSDKAVDAVENTGEGILSSFNSLFESLGDNVASNPILRRIAEAYGFKFAEGIEDSIPLIEETAEEAGEIIPEAVADGVKEKEKLTFSAFDSLFTKMADTAYGYTNTAMNYLGGLFNAQVSLQDTILEEEAKTKQAEIDATKKATEEKIRKAEEEHDRNVALIEDQYERGLISIEEYAAQKKAYDKDLTDYKESQLKAEEEAEKRLAKEKDDILRKQFEAKQKSDKASVWINLATSVMKAYADLGFIAGSVAAVVLSATAATQIAEIDKQKYTPAFAKGGIVDDATYGLLGEDGREAVVPLERNTEWVGGLARAISPAIQSSSEYSSSEIRTLREEIRDLRMMLSEYLTRIIDKRTDIILDGSSLASVIAPSIDASLGDINRLRARGI